MSIVHVLNKRVLDRGVITNIHNKDRQSMKNDHKSEVGEKFIKMEGRIKW